MPVCAHLSLVSTLPVVTGMGRRPVRMLMDPRNQGDEGRLHLQLAATAPGPGCRWNMRIGHSCYCCYTVDRSVQPWSVCGHDAGRNVKNAGLCNAGLGVARGGGQDNLCWHQLHLITSQRPRSHGPDRIFRLHTGSTAEICSNIDPKMKMYSHKSMKPHAILRIETILIDLTFIKLKTRIIT